MTFDNLLLADDGGVRTITINRPDKLNALNAATIGELLHAFTQARGAADVRVVVLAGAGDRAFVAGADISELAELSAMQAQHFARQGQQLMRLIETLGKPVIARIQGYALGGGMEIAMSCHLRVASDSARLGQPEIGLGLIPGFGGTQRLVRLAGRSAALELCLLGSQIDAARGHALGILSHVVPAAELDDTVQNLAAQLAASAPHALAGVLDAVIHGAECPLEQGLDYEVKSFALCASTADMREGTQAFLQRRKPEFTGA